MRILESLWRRYVIRRPQSYRLYVRLPTQLGGEESLLDPVADEVDELLCACEGYLDVYGVPDGLVVSTDHVPATSFDEVAFEACLDRIEALYDDVYSLAVVTKWRTRDRRVVKSYDVVPVKPLFPRSRLDAETATVAPPPER